VARIPLLDINIVDVKEQAPFIAKIIITSTGTKALVLRADPSGKCEINHALAAVKAGKASGAKAPAAVPGTKSSNTHFKQPIKRVWSSPANTARAVPAKINPKFGRKWSRKKRDKVSMDSLQKSVGQLTCPFDTKVGIKSNYRVNFKTLGFEITSEMFGYAKI
jgi:hypothetical protein